VSLQLSATAVASITFREYYKYVCTNKSRMARPVGKKIYFYITDYMHGVVVSIKCVCNFVCLHLLN
jgi:hypothetical protein